MRPSSLLIPGRPLLLLTVAGWAPAGPLLPLLLRAVVGPPLLRRPPIGPALPLLAAAAGAPVLPERRPPLLPGPLLPLPLLALPVLLALAVLGPPTWRRRPLHGLRPGLLQGCLLLLQLRQWDGLGWRHIDHEKV